MKIKCTLIKADEPTINERVYPRKTLEDAIEKYNLNNVNLGECHYNNREKYPVGISLENVSHSMKKLEINENGELIADIILLDTPTGKIIKQMVNEGLELDLFPRFIGKCNEDNIVDVEKIDAIDIMAKEKPDD